MENKEYDYEKMWYDLKNEFGNMVHIFTSYFGNHRKFKEYKEVYSVSAIQPPGCIFSIISEFIPNQLNVLSLRNKSIDQLFFFTRIYCKIR